MSQYKLVEAGPWEMAESENWARAGEGFYDFSEGGSCFISTTSCPKCGANDFNILGGIKNGKFESDGFHCMECWFGGEVEVFFGEIDPPLDAWWVPSLPTCVVVDIEDKQNPEIEAHDFFDVYDELTEVNREEEIIVISTKSENDDCGWDYEIPFSWLQNNNDIAHWMSHLSGKSWMTMDKFESLGNAIMRLSREGLI